MQQIIIYLNIKPYRMLFFSKTRALQILDGKEGEWSDLIFRASWW
jgi:hypothetical protein